MKTRIMYVENKETGKATISRIAFSRTFQTVYYKDRTLQRSGSAARKGNFLDSETHEEYWVSGCKKRGSDAHWAERVPVVVDEDVSEEYWTAIRI